MAIASNSPPDAPDSIVDTAGSRPPPPPMAPPASEDKRLAWTREVTTIILAAAIVAVALTLLALTFAAASNFTEKKDVMLYGLTLVGTVIGYYFGRVPAERRAEASEETAKRAQTAASDANLLAGFADEKLHETKSVVERTMKLLAPVAGVPQRKTLGLESLSPAGQAERVSEALSELELLARRL